MRNWLTKKVIEKATPYIIKGAKAVKEGITAPKTNKPLYTAAGAVTAAKIAYEKAKAKLKKKKKDKE